MSLDINIQRYESCSFNEWNDFNKRAKNSLFMFDRNYMEYHSDRYIDHSLMFYKDEKLIALLPMNEKDDVLYSHGGLTYGGFITDEKMNQSLMLECFEALREYCKDNGFHKLIYKAIPYIYYSQPAGEDRYALFRVGAKISKIEASTVINLDDPIKMAALRKRQIKKAINNKVIIKKSTTYEEYKQYIDVLNDVLGEYHNAVAVHTADELYLLYSRFPDNIHLYSAWYEGKMAAGTVIFEYENMIHTQYLASNDIGRTIGALDLTIQTVIDDYSGNKIYMDFGKSTEDDGKYLNEGLISQKEGFGGRSVPYDTWEWNVE